MPVGLDGNPDPVTSPERTAVLGRVVDAVRALDAGPRVLVAVDGASGTGKSTFADELAGRLRSDGHAVLRASIDSFHRPRVERYARGPRSAEGYYRDSHQLDAVRSVLLDPFRSGAPTVVTEAFDEPSDAPVDAEPTSVAAEAVLVFDGIFALRPELAPCWDLAVHLVADGRREAAWQAYLTADLPDDPDERDAEVARRTERARRPRYLEGQALYEAEARPRERAGLVIDNDDLAHPRVLGT